MFEYKLIFQDLEDNQVFKFDDSSISNYCGTCEYETIYIKCPYYISLSYLCKCYYCGRRYTTDFDSDVQLIRTIEI
jgi:hypothetical protein